MPEAFFLALEPGQRFCLLHTPEGAARRAVVHVHPFAEEMNKARRMAALAARRLAAEGCAVLQIDLLGCGDSSGDFRDARWELWRRDVQAALDWMRRRFAAPLALWGVRLGALLAAELAQRETGLERLLLWQPVTNGSQFLTQFLRLRLASEMLASGAAASGTRELSQALAQGRSLEIAGYELHPELAAAIEGLRLEALAPAVKRVDWLEVVDDASAELRPPARRVVDAWRGRGIDVRPAQAAGEPFWSTIEIAESPALLEATSGVMREAP